MKVRCLLAIALGLSCIATASGQIDDRFVYQALLPQDDCLPEEGRRFQFASDIAAKDGTMVVSVQGARRDGVVYHGLLDIYEKDDRGFWELVDTIIPDPSLGDTSGFGTEIDFDGERIVVTAPRDGTIPPVPDREDAVYVYKRDSSGGWLLEERIAAPTDTGFEFASFAYAVAIDGDTLVVSDYGAQAPTAGESGALVIYKFDGTRWVLTSIDSAPSRGSTSNFFLVAISGDQAVATIAGDRVSIEGGFRIYDTATGTYQEVRDSGSELGSWDVLAMRDGQIAARKSRRFGDLSCGMIRIYDADGSGQYAHTDTIEHACFLPSSIADDGRRRMIFDDDRLLISGWAFDDRLSSQARIGLDVFRQINGEWVEEEPIFHATRGFYYFSSNNRTPVAVDGDSAMLGYEWRGQSRGTCPDGPQRGVVSVFDIGDDYCRADLDRDGQLTIFDFLEFGRMFEEGYPVADFEPDGYFNLPDFLAFLNAFDAGCGG